jgi:DNA-binding response OmpR family regulator
MASGTTSIGPHANGAPRSALRILVVEDDPADAHLTEAALREQLIGCEVFILATCRDALAFVERHRDAPVDIVLLDVKLPDGNGIDLLQRLQDDGRLEHTRVVVFSGARDGRQVVRAYELGASFYLVKPGDFGAYDKVVDALRRCVTTPLPEHP